MFNLSDLKVVNTLESLPVNVTLKGKIKSVGSSYNKVTETLLMSITLETDKKQYQSLHYFPTNPEQAGQFEGTRKTVSELAKQVGASDNFEELTKKVNTLFNFHIVKVPNPDKPGNFYTNIKYYPAPEINEDSADFGI